jgi:phosphate transport system permease protein
MTNWRFLKDKIARRGMIALAFTSLLLVIGMGGGLFAKSLPILQEHSLSNLLFSSSWHPMKGEFGFFPFIMGTIWVTLLAIVLAFPISILVAVFLTGFSQKRIWKLVYPILDILASLPSVIYGVWGTLLIVPWISRFLGPIFVEYTSGYTVLAGGIVLAVMILPVLISLMTELFKTVPEELRDVSISLGATTWQTAKFVILRKTKAGIFAIVALAISRALGETIAVLMVCGNSAETPHSIFNACYPLSALIANNYGEMLSVPLYESALMLAAFLLFIIVLIFNLSSQLVLRYIKTNE